MPIILITWEAEIRRIVVPGQPQENSSQDPISKSNQRKMDWKCVSSCRAPALQVQSPEFKSKSHKKRIKVKYWGMEIGG
jgi:hypothetical protein